MLSVRQMVVERVLLKGLDILHRQEPENLCKMLTPQPLHYRTRGSCRSTERPSETYELGKRSFKNMFLTTVSLLPDSYKVGDPKKFKSSIRARVKDDCAPKTYWRESLSV